MEEGVENLAKTHSFDNSISLDILAKLRIDLDPTNPKSLEWMDPPLKFKLARIS